MASKSVIGPKRSSSSLATELSSGVRFIGPGDRQSFQKRANSLSKSLFSAFGSVPTPRNKKRRRRDSSSSSMRASLAQIQVVQALEPALKSEDEFLALFKEGLDTRATFDDDYHEASNSNQGMNTLLGLMQRPLYFVMNTDHGSERKERSVRFDPGDKIFKLSGPNEDFTQEANRNPHCNCCLGPYKNQKDVRYCHFCSLACCSRCRYKTRAFPRSLDGQRGDICKECESKFWIQAMLQEKQAKIDMQKEKLVGERGLKKRIETSKTELRRVNQQFKRTKEMYRLDFKKVQVMIKRAKQQIEDLNREEKWRQQEINQINDQRSANERKTTEINQEAENLQAELSELMAEAATVDDHLTVAHQEKRKLEREYVALLDELKEKRQGNQPGQKPPRRPKAPATMANTKVNSKVKGSFAKSPKGSSRQSDSKNPKPILMLPDMRRSLSPPKERLGSDSFDQGRAPATSLTSEKVSFMIDEEDDSRKLYVQTSLDSSAPQYLLNRTKNSNTSYEEQLDEMPDFHRKKKKLGIRQRGGNSSAQVCCSTQSKCSIF